MLSRNWKLAWFLACVSLLISWCSIQLAGAQTLYGVTGRGGDPSATLHVIDTTDASVTAILPLNDNNGGQVIAYNSDDGQLYHWTGWPSTNTRMEKIDLETLAVTQIPLSGFATNEVQSAVYDPHSGSFLLTDLSLNLTQVTPDGIRTRIGSTDNWVRGLTFVGDALYGGHNSLIPVNELWEIDPATGDFLSTKYVTLEGYTVASFSAAATNPRTGELWALLMVLEYPKQTRLLTRIDPATGVATLVGVMPDGSGFSGLAFVPDPVIEVQIDVKPGDAINAINLGSNGVIPVAILSSAEFDATTVAPATVSLAGAGVSVRGRGQLLAHEDDVDGDGWVDLICQVDTECLPGGLASGEVHLTGFTYAGDPIDGVDMILVVPQGQ